MPHSEVTKIELNDNNIDLTVKVRGFDDGQPVEVSGHASQTNGAIATFYTLQRFTPDSDGNFFVTVTADPSMDFMTGEVITVVGRAAKIWSTVLHPDSAEHRKGIKAVWKAPKNQPHR